MNKTETFVCVSQSRFSGYYVVPLGLMPIDNDNAQKKFQHSLCYNKG